jgi:hypothetical protein
VEFLWLARTSCCAVYARRCQLKFLTFSDFSRSGKILKFWFRWREIGWRALEVELVFIEIVFASGVFNLFWEEKQEKRIDKVLIVWMNLKAFGKLQSFVVKMINFWSIRRKIGLQRFFWFSLWILLTIFSKTTMISDKNIFWLSVMIVWDFLNLNPLNPFQIFFNDSPPSLVESLQL